MQPIPRRPRVKLTSEAQARLRQELQDSRDRIIQAMNAVTIDLPREANGLLDAVAPGFPNQFHWSHDFLFQGALWTLDCLVSKAGWPDILWITDVFARWVDPQQ
jgi:hypothetical protein